jgi:hypothetical protein
MLAKKAKAEKDMALIMFVTGIGTMGLRKALAAYQKIHEANR